MSAERKSLSVGSWRKLSTDEPLWAGDYVSYEDDDLFEIDPGLIGTRVQDKYFCDYYRPAAASGED